MESERRDTSLCRSSDLRLFLKFSIFSSYLRKLEFAYALRSLVRRKFGHTQTHTHTHTHVIVDKKGPAWEACRNDHTPPTTHPNKIQLLHDSGR